MPNPFSFRVQATVADPGDSRWLQEKGTARGDRTTLPGVNIGGNQYGRYVFEFETLEGRETFTET